MQSARGLSSAHGLLTAEEISRTSALTAYEAVRALRPSFMKIRGPRLSGEVTRTTAYPAVYLNGMYYGDTESLKSLYVIDIRDIGYIDSNEAMLKFGKDHLAGAIMVNSKTE
jgi:hypothetical protein